MAKAIKVNGKSAIYSTLVVNALFCELWCVQNVARQFFILHLRFTLLLCYDLLVVRIHFLLLSHSFSCNSLLELRHKFRMRECEFGTENMLDWIQEKRATKMNISYVIIFFSSPFGRAYITILFSSNVHLESRGNVNRLQ